MTSDGVAFAPMAPVYDVIIVGAGPVGSVAASLAARHGLRTLIVDKSPGVFPLPRAIHFDADIMRIFQFAGLADRIEPFVRATSGGVHLGVDGEPIRDFRVTARTGDLGWKPHYMFYQPEIDALLRQAASDAEGVQLRLGWQFDGLRQDPDSDLVTVDLRGPDGTTAQAVGHYILGADGASSAVRRALGIALADDGFEEPWVVIDGQVDHEDLGPDYTIMYCDPRRPGTYIPGPRNHRRWEFMLLPGEDGSAFTTDAGARGLVQSVTPWLDVTELRIERVAVYRFHALVATSWRDERVFLLGDAAHQTPPFYGQGMCHGIRDARNLLWKIAAVLEAGADETLLDTYELERRPHVEAIIAQSVANGRYICTLDPTVAEQRDRDMRAAMNAPAAARSFRDIIPGLTSGIRDDSDGTGATGLLFPQPAVLAADGDPTLLDELLGDGFALVSEVPVPTDLRERWDGSVLVLGEDFQDPEGLLHSWFEAFGAITAVIRPDRYVYGVADDLEDLRRLCSALRDGRGLRGSGPAAAERVRLGTP